ncbi:hypothetical protein GCM10011571_06890 [Marinithermofilum abyssi]|uniref:AIM24 family protein n=1 Tax=Marinithermofilum abyssi TaxID=1571185 RepID=A0A8J2VEI5_9BACL|nr:AIM24 family protein [Marinithermofilum abyssi]GGE08266.1 hypothetical protein GCM10011571_06890 [Marinithermofilum abyssi]
MAESLDHLLHKAEEVNTQESFVLQNNKALKIRVTDTVFCRQGSMIAYQGDIKFSSTSGGIGKWLKKKITGEGVPLMKAEGQGDLFLADNAADITILRLNGETLYVEGRHLLAFEQTVNWDISVIRGAGIASGGLFTCKLSGHGFVAISSHGQPIALDAPVVVDPNAVIGWTEGVSTGIKTDINLKTLLGKSSGETVQLNFKGRGKVLIQPAEWVSFGEVE